MQRANSKGRNCVKQATITQQVNDLGLDRFMNEKLLLLPSGMATAAFLRTQGKIYVIGLELVRLGAIKVTCLTRYLNSSSSI